MIAAWMAYTALVTALIALGAFGADRIAGLLHGPRRIVWSTAFALTVLGPALAMRGQPIARTSRPVVTAPSTETAAPQPRPLAPEIPELISPTRRIHRSVLDRLDVPLAALWLLASIALAGLAAVDVARHARARRRWSLGQFAGAQVLVSPDTGPASVGVLHPAIVVPEWALALPAREQQLMLRHEREHIRARDPLLRAVCWTTCVLAPWNAAAWWMLRRLTLAIEIDCDARVLRATPDVAAYGTLLVDVGARVQTHRHVGTVTALSESPSALERRIIAMTARRPTRYRRAVATVGILAMAPILGATALPHPASPSLDIRSLRWHAAQSDSDVARANKAAAAVLEDLVTQQEEYFGDYNTYSSDVAKISGYRSTRGEGSGLHDPGQVKIRILGAHSYGWSAEATLPEMHGGSCIVLVGTVPQSEWPQTALEHKRNLKEGSPICDGDGQPSGVSWAPATQSIVMGTMKERAKLEEEIFQNTGAFVTLNFRTMMRDLYQFTVLPGGKYYWAAEATINGVPAKSCVVWTGLMTDADQPPHTAAQHLTSSKANVPVCDPM